MNHLEWLNWRKEGIGGSDAAVVLKKFPFGKTPLMLYREKISQKCEDSSNSAIKHGQMYENDALDWFEKKMGCTLFRQTRVVHKDVPWIRATLDGMDLDGKYLVEVKCPYNLENHYIVKATKKVPEIYYPQCQHQMKAKEMDGMYFESFNYEDPDDSIIIEVQRDEKFIEGALPEYEKFWNCVKNLTPPEMTDYDFFCMEENQEWKNASEKLKEAEKWIREFDYWRNELVKLSDGKSSKGAGITVSHSECKGHVDYDKIPELIGVDRDIYRKPSFPKTTVRFTDR